MTTRITSTISFSGSKKIDLIFEEAIKRLESARLSSDVESPLAQVFFGQVNFDAHPQHHGLTLVEASSMGFVVESLHTPDELIKYLVQVLAAVDRRCYVENYAHEEEFRKFFQLGWLGKQGPLVATRDVWIDFPDELEFDDPDDFEEARVRAQEESDEAIELERENLFQLKVSGASTV
jgi:hypothetical protein